MDELATKQDLRELEDNLKQNVRELEQRLKEGFRREFQSQRDDMIEAMRDMQTEVLRAFHNWASPLEVRVRHIPEIEQRLAWLEDRVSAIERGEGPPRPTS